MRSTLLTLHTGRSIEIAERFFMVLAVLRRKRPAGRHALGRSK